MTWIFGDIDIYEEKLKLSKNVLKSFDLVTQREISPCV